MIEQFLAIVRNTFLESIRQPIVLVLLVVATILLVLSSVTATFTMEDDQKMLIDVGLGTIFIFGALLAAFIATNVLTREIENKTVLTVVSKPVGRALFVVGKFVGVTGAILLAVLYLTLVFMLVEMHGVRQTVRTPYHLPAIIFGFSAAGLALLVAVWSNYFYNRVFVSTTIGVVTPAVAVAYVVALFFGPHFERVPVSEQFDANLWIAAVGLMIAIVLLTAIAIAVSTRAGQLMTILVTVGIFLLGMLADALAGRQFEAIEERWMERAEQAGQVVEEEITRRIERTDGQVIESTTTARIPQVPLEEFARGNEVLVHDAAAFVYRLVPNFQVLWLSDAVTQEHVIPNSYLVRTSAYGGLYTIAALGFAVVLFQRREVG